MADISLLRNEDMEDTDEPMEGADDEEAGGDGPADGRGDEGGGENVPPMTKLQQHASCNLTYNRQLVGRILVEVFRGAVESGTELNVDEVMQPVLKLVNDTDSVVRIDLVEQLPQVAMICQEAPEILGDVLPRHLIQIISTFLRDGDQKVRQSTHAALSALIDRGLLDKKSAEDVVAPTLLAISQQIERVETFTHVVDSISKVARILDEATAERLFLNRYLALSRDNNFFIRKLCAFRFGEFSAAMGKEAIYKKLLPAYITLCKDPIWTVRKSCADTIVSFACCVSLHHRRATLSELLANFLTDDSKWVKVSAFQILGPFISTFAKQFTGFSYNQYGELVLTDQHGTELRYNVLSFPGSAEPPLCKVVMRSGQIVHFYEEDGTPVSKTFQHSVSNRSERGKENIPLEIRSKLQWNISIALNDDNSENDATLNHDYDQFNPFRYYYISPDLPLDTELVQAAIVESTSGVESPDRRRKYKVEQIGDHPIEPDKTSDDDNQQQEQQQQQQQRDVEREREQSKMANEANEEEKEAEKEKEAEEEKKEEDGEGEEEKKREKSNEKDGNLNEGNTVWAEAQKNRNVTSDSAECYCDFSIFNTSDGLNDTADITGSMSIDRSDLGTSGSSTIPNVGSTIDNGQTIVPNVLVNFFVWMADPSIGMSIGVEIQRHCAFSFPAVALTLGRENWPLLKKAYRELADAREYRVRRTMASSIHELAMILGEELTARDLLPIYDGFIKDLDEVRIGALKHLTKFLKVLGPKDRQQFLPRLKAFLMMDNEWNWRFRQEVASRLLEAIPLFSPNDVSDHIAPLSFPLLNDKVAAVRHTALALVTQIVSYLSGNEHLVTTLIQDLKFLLGSEPSKWTSRQAFALLCSSLIDNDALSGEIFGRDMLPCLLILSSDVVPNVRIAVATALELLTPNYSDYLSPDHAEKVSQKLAQMRTDPDRDVRIIAGGVAGKYYPQRKVRPNCERTQMPQTAIFSRREMRRYDNIEVALVNELRREVEDGRRKKSQVTEVTFDK